MTDHVMRGWTGVRCIGQAVKYAVDAILHVLDSLRNLC